MNKLRKFAKDLWSDESGQGMLEYVLLVVAIVAVIAIFKGKIKDWFTSTSDRIGNNVESINSN